MEALKPQYKNNATSLPLSIKLSLFVKTLLSAYFHAEAQRVFSYQSQTHLHWDIFFSSKNHVGVLMTDWVTIKA